MFGFMSKVKDFVAQNVTDIATKVKQEVTQFVEENKRLEENAKQEEKREHEAHLPWENVKIISNSNGNIRELIKEEILELSANEENFLAEESSYMFEFDFNMEEYKYRAIKIMEYDERLGLIRNKLVPSKLSDERFWKNYYYNVELIKMKHAIKAEEDALRKEEEEENGEKYEDDDVLKSDEREEVGISISNHPKKEVEEKENEVENNSKEDKEGQEVKEDKSPDFDIKLENN